MHRAFNNLLDWINTQGDIIPLRTLCVVDRGTYGWVEYVEHISCKSDEELEQFYTRAGMLLCLGHLLGGNDFHCENLIACGEHPVLVDTETLINNDLRHDTSFTLDNFYSGDAWDTVLRTGLLPIWIVDEENHPVDLSGLGAVGVQPLSQRKIVWQHVNTDVMETDWETITVYPQQNIPFQPGATANPNCYVVQIIDGFTQVYRFLMDNQEALLAADGPLQAFDGLLFRFVLRPSQSYAHLSQHSLQAPFLRNGADRSILLDALVRETSGAMASPLARFFLADEINALENLDVPRFTGKTDCCSLELDSGRSVKAFDESSFSLTLKRIRGMSESQLNKQISYIRGSFYTRLIADESKNHARFDTVDETEVSAINDYALREAVATIYERIKAQAISTETKAVTWFILKNFKSLKRYQLQPMNHSLYDGHCGVALFLAAYARLERDTQAKNLALDALSIVRTALSNPTANSELSKMPVGIGFGLGSIVYGLVCVGQLLEADELYTDAERAAQFITDQVIEQDPHLDIVLGTAGALLGLLALHAITGSSDVLQRAKACGEILLNRQVETGNGVGWSNGDGVVGSGFSHGAAGIGYALFRLYQVTNDVSLLRTIEQAIQFENTLYDPALKNWLYFRPLDSTIPAICQATWCHGAPGIGLSRCMLTQYFSSPVIDSDIDKAINATLRNKRSLVDHLCCGSLGIIDVLMEIGVRQRRPELCTIAQREVAYVVARAKQVGTFSLDTDLPDLQNVTLFKGLAGIGYGLLRVLHYGQLPSVLLFE